MNPETYQNLLRKKLKAKQSQISNLDTLSKLPDSQKEKIIQRANQSISRIDNLIKKKLMQEEQDQEQEQQQKKPLQQVLGDCLCYQLHQLKQQ